MPVRNPRTGQLEMTEQERQFMQGLTGTQPQPAQPQPRWGAPVPTPEELAQLHAQAQANLDQLRMQQPLNKEEVAAKLRAQADQDVAQEIQPEPKFQQLRSKLQESQGPIEMADDEDVKVGFQE